MDSAQNLIIALVVACSSMAAISVVSLCFWIYHVRCERKAYTDTSSPESLEAQKGLSLASLLGKFSSLKVTNKKASAAFIDYKLLLKATNNFDSADILGEGGFGCVYKGTLDDNTQVAVKKLDQGSQGVTKEFQIEVHLLSKMYHPNVISLVGYSVHGQTRCIVYELMQNGSLESQLYRPCGGSVLTWHMRMKIALDTARGVEYLHDKCKPRVIHRDLKTANILLDADFNAKLSDFGLAVTDRSCKKDKSDLSGTLGYVAPEYLLDGKLTEKSDVYGFGVVLLELLLGRRPIEKLAPGQCQSIVSWAMPQLTDRAKLPNIVDPAIKDTMDTKHLYQVAAVALLCVQSEPTYRPLISDVLHSLVPLVPLELGGTLSAPKSALSD